MTWRGDWQAHVHYDAGHLAMDGGIVYLCKHPVSSATEPGSDSTHWVLLGGGYVVDAASTP
jgi:hypothetical protein